MLFGPNKLAWVMSGLYLLSPLGLEAGAAEIERTESAGESAENKKIELAPTSVHGSVIDKDEAGHNQVYRENVTNLYLDREELERFQTTNPGDVFKGMNGVYSMDSRNGSSITPNVRGLSGEGRVPLTIDGTEQSTNVWLQVYGAGNRNYVDPALFRSISVEKGPSLSRDVKSGVGGSVNIRTIEASDIIAEGDNFGIEFKTESSGNTIKPKVDANSYFGQDYRSIPGATLGSDNNVNIPQPEADTAVVAIDDLHKSYADHHVLKGISMRAKEGEVVSLIGSLPSTVAYSGWLSVTATTSITSAYSMAPALRSRNGNSSPTASAPSWAARKAKAARWSPRPASPASCTWNCSTRPSASTA